MRENLKRKITGIIFIAVCLLANKLLAAEFAGGTGQPNDPYQIATAEQLTSIGDDLLLLQKHYVLVNDIDLDPNLPGGQVFTRAVIAPSHRFIGSFDGNGYSISNMVINSNSSGRDNLGLIGFLDSDSIVKDIQLRNITISGNGDYFGALAGSSDGIVLQCSVTGNISGRAWVGGLVGYNFGYIVACSALCNLQPVTGDILGIAGGLVGDNHGYISNCCATGTVTGGDALGGLVGENGGDISNSYAMGAVAGEEWVGGLIGVSYSDAVSQCYAACEIITDSNDSIGGLIGERGGTICARRGEIADSFWDVQVSGQKISAGGIGLPTAKLQDSGTYLSAGWNMAGETSNGLADIWTIAEPNTYPQLIRLTDQYTFPHLPGSGIPDDPYEIATAAELVAINDYDINANYVLVADIDMSGMVWATAPILFFNGTLNGQGHTISNLSIKGVNYLGLFGEIITDGVVTNLTIQNAYIIGNERVGTLAGQCIGHITNCHSTGSVTGVSYVGGLVGSVYGSTFEETISDCTADVAVSGNVNVHNIAYAHYFQ